MSAGVSACPIGGERPLTSGEISLVQSVFGNAIDCGKVRLRRRKWFPFQPRKVTMAPDGHLYFHPGGQSYCDDFSQAGLASQGHFIHEMVHVWQAQRKGNWFLVLHRHPWCRYDYSLKPGWPLERYGIEQQAEIVRHAFTLMRGGTVAGAPGLDRYRSILPFLPLKSRDSTHAA
ncbi:MAG TPA: vgr related protein [Sphingomonadaceae bacterium]|nr:vgr related protein [Sphingomonadaceae bacterium]